MCSCRPWWPLSVNTVAVYGPPLTLVRSCSVSHDLFASPLSLPPTRDISITMAVSSHVIYQVHWVMGQLCAEPYFPLVLAPEAGGSLAELKAFVYLILGPWINQECPDMNFGMFFFHGKGNCGKWDLRRQRTIPGDLL